jgi:hypothetical protein
VRSFDKIIQGFSPPLGDSQVILATLPANEMLEGSDLVSSLIDQLERQVPSFHVENISHANIDGNIVTKFVYSFESGPKSIKVMQLFAKMKDTFYLLQYSSLNVPNWYSLPIDVYTFNLPEVEHMINSFKINNTYLFGNNSTIANETSKYYSIMNSNNNTNQISFQTFRSNNLGITIKYPSDWFHQEGSSLVFYPIEEKNIRIEIGKENKPLSLPPKEYALQQIIKYVNPETSSHLTNYTTLDPVRTELLNGKPAITWTYTYNLGDELIKVLRILIEYPDYRSILIFDYIAPNDIHKSFLYIYNEMLNSIKFN